MIKMTNGQGSSLTSEVAQTFVTQPPAHLGLVPVGSMGLYSRETHAQAEKTINPQCLREAGWDPGVIPNVNTGLAAVKSRARKTEGAQQGGQVTSDRMGG